MVIEVGHNFQRVEMETKHSPSDTPTSQSTSSNGKAADPLHIKSSSTQPNERESQDTVHESASEGLFTSRFPESEKKHVIHMRNPPARFSELTPEELAKNDSEERKTSFTITSPFGDQSSSDGEQLLYLSVDGSEITSPYPENSASDTKRSSLTSQDFPPHPHLGVIPEAETSPSFENISINNSHHRNSHDGLPSPSLKSRTSKSSSISSGQDLLYATTQSHEMQSRELVYNSSHNLSHAAEGHDDAHAIHLHHHQHHHLRNHTETSSLKNSKIHRMFHLTRSRSEHETGGASGDPSASDHSTNGTTSGRNSPDNQIHASADWTHIARKRSESSPVSRGILFQLKTPSKNDLSASDRKADHAFFASGGEEFLATPTECSEEIPAHGSIFALFRRKTMQKKAPTPTATDSLPHSQDHDDDGKKSSTLKPLSRSGSRNLTRTSSEVSFSEKYGKYEERLGRGAFASVRLVRAKAIEGLSKKGKLLAVKKFKRKEKKESQKDYEKRLFAEFCISSSLKHENIVESVDLIQDDHENWLEVMEYMPGGDLNSALQRGYINESTEIYCYFRQIVTAVTYLHSVGVSHRDLKPENILIDASHRIVKIADFGIAAVFRPAFESKNHLVKGVNGTEPYMAPEVFTAEGAEYDGVKVDVWSIAIILYNMLYRSVPWRIAKPSDYHYNQYTTQRNPELLRGYPPFDRITPGPRGVIYRLLDPNPETRMTLSELADNEWFRSIESCHEMDVGEGKGELVLDSVHSGIGEEEMYKFDGIQHYHHGHYENHILK